MWWAASIGRRRRCGLAALRRVAVPVARTLGARRQRRRALGLSSSSQARSRCAPSHAAITSGASSLASKLAHVHALRDAVSLTAAASASHSPPPQACSRWPRTLVVPVLVRCAGRRQLDLTTSDVFDGHAALRRRPGIATHAQRAPRSGDQTSGGGQRFCTSVADVTLPSASITTLDAARRRTASSRSIALTGCHGRQRLRD